MRACGNCGESGHNKRTCKKGDIKTTSAAVAVAPSAKPPAKPNPRLNGVKEELDEETKEAIDWYMEKNHPGYLARKKEREKNGPVEPEPEEDESDA